MMIRMTVKKTRAPREIRMIEKTKMTEVDQRKRGEARKEEIINEIQERIVMMDVKVIRE